MIRALLAVPVAALLLGGSAGRAAGASASGAAVAARLSAGARPRVAVEILSRHAPRWLAIEGPRTYHVQAGAAGLVVDGAARPALDLPEGRWRLRGEGFDRSYMGALSLRASGGAVAARLVQPLERYVADVVAAESEPGTPPAALRALAVVVRSFAVAARDRHEGGGLCDLAHCQITAGAGAGRHAADARAAAAATAGQVLLVGEAVAAAPFHAACGGHTADPIATFGGPLDRSGGAAIADGCDPAPWEALLDRGMVEEAVHELLGPTASVDRLRMERGPGGFVTHVVDPAAGRRATGEAFARWLDRAAGWGAVRSPRFFLDAAGAGSVRLRGQGHGHGVGLCQAGARRLAARGLDHEAILARYFPRARLGSLSDLAPHQRPAE